MQSVKKLKVPKVNAHVRICYNNPCLDFGFLKTFVTALSLSHFTPNKMSVNFYLLSPFSKKPWQLKKKLKTIFFYDSNSWK
jgi:hypothetical protein